MTDHEEVRRTYVEMRAYMIAATKQRAALYVCVINAIAAVAFYLGVMRGSADPIGAALMYFIATIGHWFMQWTFCIDTKKEDAT